MNSSTGDFIEIKKACISEELYKRATRSCVKSKPYCPKKYIMPLQPLDLAVIKKELEESWNEPLIDCFDQQEENDNKSTEDCEDTAVNDVFRKDPSELSEELIIRDKSNNTSSSQYKPEIENDQQFLNTQHDTKPNSNLSVILEEKENKLTHHSKKNDSFDLDFSVLSLQTPVKNSVSNTKYGKTASVKKQFEFLTPKVNNIITSQNSLSKRTYFKTPVNPVTNSLKKSYTPASSIANKPTSQKISFKLPFDDVNNKCEGGTESISPNISSEVFQRIKVNKVEYIVFNLLGKGGSSEVYHCYNVEKKCHVAIKSVSLQNSSSEESYINEVKLLQQLQTCEKIIKMYDYEKVDSQKKLLVVLEKGGEDLSTILKRLVSQQSHLPMYMLLFYWMEMLYAVKQIHSHGIIHSDLKPANFLKADGGLKLIDFGIASSVQTDMTSVIKTVREGSCNYISPEALLNNDTNIENKHCDNAKYKLHYKSDVWSLGCILYQMVYRRTPFQHYSQLWSKFAAITNPDYKIDYPDADWVSSKIINTIQKCLQYNVKLRPSVDELVAEYENILNNI